MSEEVTLQIPSSRPQRCPRILRASQSAVQAPPPLPSILEAEVVERDVSAFQAEAPPASFVDVPETGFPKPRRRRPPPVQQEKPRQQPAPSVDERIAEMTEAEIAEAQAEIASLLGPELAEQIRQKHQQRQPTLPTDHPHSLEIQLSNPALGTAAPLILNPQEAEKLKWTDPLSKEEEGGREVDPRGFNMRFDLDGRVVNSETSSSELYHHGKEAGMPGYTLSEVTSYWLASSQPGQRVAALRLLRGVLRDPPLLSEAQSMGSWETFVYEKLELHWKTHQLLMDSTHQGTGRWCIEVLAELLDPQQRSGLPFCAALMALQGEEPRPSKHCWTAASRRLLTDGRSQRVFQTSPQNSFDESTLRLFHPQSDDCDQVVSELSQYDIIFHLLKARQDVGHQVLLVDACARLLAEVTADKVASLRVLTALCRHSHEVCLHTVWASSAVVEAIEACAQRMVVESGDQETRIQLLRFLEVSCVMLGSKKAECLPATCVLFARKCLYHEDGKPIDEEVRAGALDLFCAWCQVGWWVEDLAALFPDLLIHTEEVARRLPTSNEEYEKGVAPLQWLISLSRFLLTYLEKTDAQENGIEEIAALGMRLLGIIDTRLYGLFTKMSRDSESLVILILTFCVETLELVARLLGALEDGAKGPAHTRTAALLDRGLSSSLRRESILDLKKLPIDHEGFAHEGFIRCMLDAGVFSPYIPRLSGLACPRSAAPLCSLLRYQLALSALRVRKVLQPTLPHLPLTKEVSAGRPQSLEDTAVALSQWGSSFVSKHLAAARGLAQQDVRLCAGSLTLRALPWLAPFAQEGGDRWGAVATWHQADRIVKSDLAEVASDLCRVASGYPDDTQPPSAASPWVVNSLPDSTWHLLEQAYRGGHDATFYSRSKDSAKLSLTIANLLPVYLLLERLCRVAVMGAAPCEEAWASLWGAVTTTLEDRLQVCESVTPSGWPQAARDVTEERLVRSLDSITEKLKEDPSLFHGSWRTRVLWLFAESQSPLACRRSFWSDHDALRLLFRLAPPKKPRASDPSPVIGRMQKAFYDVFI